MKTIELNENEANELIGELSTLMPNREDIFFRRGRIVNDRMNIGGDCCGWINEQVAFSLT